MPFGLRQILSTLLPSPRTLCDETIFQVPTSCSLSDFCWATASPAGNEIPRISSDTAVAVSTASLLIMFLSLISIETPWTGRRIVIAAWLLDDLVRSRHHVGWNGETDLLRRLEIDHELELRCLLHRQIGRLGSLQDSV